MGSFSIWHWLIAGLVVLVLFGGKGKLSGIMGDAAKGIKAFREGLKTEDGTTTQTAATDGHAQVITPAAATPVKEEPKA